MEEFWITLGVHLFQSCGNFGLVLGVQSAEEGKGEEIMKCSVECGLLYFG